jgi:hemerythrin superfamily protein
MNLFEALRLSHDTQRTLILRILQTEPASVERRELFRNLRRELAAHAAAEERCFYLPLIEHDSSMGQARHGMAEHHAMDELIEKIVAAGEKSAAWARHFGELHHKVFHHLDDEESAIFQLGGKMLTEKQKTELAVAYEEEFAKFRLGDELPVSSAESE